MKIFSERMKTDITKRIEELRLCMRKHGLNAYIVPSTDPHDSEYPTAYWEGRKWISGFTGSAGTVVITTDKAGLWTDSRYFLQAEDQLAGTSIALFKEQMPGTPSITEWLSETLPAGSVVGMCGLTCPVKEFEAMQAELSGSGITPTSTPDLLAEIWTDRPSLPQTPVFVLSTEYAGTSATEKLTAIRQYLAQKEADGLLISALDEVAWTLNLRGTDVHCNPVFVSYLYVGTSKATLYINPVKVDAETAHYLTENGVDIRPYGQVEADLAQLPSSTRVVLPADTNLALYRAAAQCHVVPDVSPVKYLKAAKNDVEIRGFHEAMKRDGVAMTRFLIWLKQAVKSLKETEVSIDRKLCELRAEQALFQGISFDTIAGYQDHGAIVHYEATPETAYTLKPEGFLLLDSGAQYLDGTTDITRTIVLGSLTEEQRTDYTLVLKGFIALSEAEFPQGTCGTQLDVLARQYMWRHGINYKHGTGHGVGHFLNVHEGPHQIRMNHMPALLQPGMTVTNEPGIYKAGRYGIRTENTMLVVKSRETEFGEFYKFEPLTLCPIDKEGIRLEMLTTEERAWLNEYHLKVYEALAPLLKQEERTWLADATSPL